LSLFDLEFMALDTRAVELADNAFGAVICDIDEEVPVAYVHRADCLCGQSGFAHNGLNDITRSDVHLGADIHIKACLFTRRAAAVLGWAAGLGCYALAA